jgi:uncharacterized membrane protein (UPF0136 family)
LVTSLGATAVRPDWDALLCGQAVNLRGIFFGSRLVIAPWILVAGATWGQRALWLALAACTLLAAWMLVRPQAVWSTWPPSIALLSFYIEISAAVRTRAALARAAPAATVSAAAPAAIKETTRGGRR